VNLIGERRDGDNDSVALDRACRRGFGHDAIFLDHQPLSSLVRHRRQGAIDVAFDGLFEHLVVNQSLVVWPRAA